MIIAATLFAALAAALLVTSGSPRRPTRRLDDAPAPSRPPPWSVVLAVLASVMTVLVAGSTVGIAGAVVAVALAATGVTVALLVRRHARERRQELRRRCVARACAAVAAQVRVGRIPAEAIASAAVDHPSLAEAVLTLQLGGDVVGGLHTAARTAGQNGLAELARAWQFSQHTGAPMAAVLDQVAAALRDDQVTQRTVAAELAGPRASGAVMAVLPLVGVGLGYLIGGNPVGFLISGPAGWACLLAGTALALVGVLWLDRLARVSEPGQDGS